MNAKALVDGLGCGRLTFILTITNIHVSISIFVPIDTNIQFNIQSTLFIINIMGGAVLLISGRVDNKEG